VKRVALGIGLAALAQLVALFLAGAGHGWTTPLLVSFSLWVLIPIALYALGGGPNSRLLLIVALVVGSIADVWLVRGTLGEDRALRSYLQFTGSAGWATVALWLSLLLFWQILAGRRLLTRTAVDA